MKKVGNSGFRYLTFFINVLTFITTGLIFLPTKGGFMSVYEEIDHWIQVTQCTNRASRPIMSSTIAGWIKEAAEKGEITWGQELELHHKLYEADRY